MPGEPFTLARRRRQSRSFAPWRALRAARRTAIRGNHRPLRGFAVGPPGLVMYYKTLSSQGLRPGLASLAPTGPRPKLRFGLHGAGVAPNPRPNPAAGIRQWKTPPAASIAQEAGARWHGAAGGEEKQTAAICFSCMPAAGFGRTESSRDAKTLRDRSSSRRGVAQGLHHRQLPAVAEGVVGSWIACHLLAVIIAPKGRQSEEAHSFSTGFPEAIPPARR